MALKEIKYFFRRPDRIPPDILQQIRDLIVRSGGVGTAYIEENLRNAYLIGYAMHRDRVIGSVTHKFPKIEYHKKIEQATGWDLSGYIERGYTSADPEFRDQDIPDVLIKGLIERSKGKKIYVTIRLDNIPPLRLTYKNGMSLVAKFVHPKTGNELGLFINQRVPPPALVIPSEKKTL